MLNSLCRLLFAQSRFFALRSLAIVAAVVVTLLAQNGVADCKFSSTPYPDATPLTLDPSGLALNGGAFIHHGNVMAAGRIDNLIFYHVGGEIIPEITHIVYTALNFQKQTAQYAFSDRSIVRVNLNGVTTAPHSQLNVSALFVSTDGATSRFFLICN